MREPAQIVHHQHVVRVGQFAQSGHLALMNGELLRQVLECVVAVACRLALRGIVHRYEVPIGVHGNPDGCGRHHHGHQQLERPVGVHGGSGSNKVEKPAQSGRTASGARVSPAYTTRCRIVTRSTK